MPALTFEETGRRLVGYQVLESRVFELMGRWSAQVPEPRIKTFLSSHAREHAWHASLWEENRPAAGDFGPDRLADLISSLSEPDEPGQTVEKLVGLYRVLLPRAVVTYSRHLALASPVSDGPVIRALRLVLNDQSEEWRQGEGLVQDLLTMPDEVARAADHQARLETLVTRSERQEGQPLPL